MTTFDPKTVLLFLLKLSFFYSRQTMLCLSYFSHFVVVILPQEIALASFCLIIATRPQELGPKSIIIAQKLREICQLILPNHTKQNPRHYSIQVAVDMAKFRNLQDDWYGGNAIHSDTISSTHRYAKYKNTSLSLIASGNENDLFQDNIHCAEIHASKWLADLTKFVLLPENSRAVCGHKKVSLTSCWMLKSWVATSSEFKQQNTVWKYYISTLICQFLQYGELLISRCIQPLWLPILKDWLKL